MATLERVMQMKEQGMSESQIIDSLKQENVSPKEINDALSQSKIKSALNTEQPGQTPVNPTQGIGEIPQPIIPGQIQAQAQQMNAQSSTQQMQPSIMPTDQAQAPMNNQPLASQQTPAQPPLPPQAQQMQSQPMQETQSFAQSQIPSSYQQSTMPYAESQEPMPPMPQGPYQDSYQEPYTEYESPQSANIETINDIAEQIAEEKNTELKKEIFEFTRFREEIISEINIMKNRVNAIEDNFHQLQIAILRKIGAYGEDIQNIAKEMHETQDSFSKILNPLTENIKELKKITKKETRPVHHTTHKTTTHPKTTHKKTTPKPKTKAHKKSTKRKSKKSKAKIEDYLR